MYDSKNGGQIHLPLAWLAAYIQSPGPVQTQPEAAAPNTGATLPPGTAFLIRQGDIIVWPKLASMFILLESVDGKEAVQPPAGSDTGDAHQLPTAVDECDDDEDDDYDDDEVSGTQP